MLQELLQKNKDTSNGGINDTSNVGGKLMAPYGILKGNMKKLQLA